MTTTQMKKTRAPCGVAFHTGDSCCVYPWSSYCTADGREGPSWRKSWGKISDFSDENGKKRTERPFPTVQEMHHFTKTGPGQT
jgi:hypothetical protein